MIPFLENKKGLGIPLPENRKVSLNPFHVFDRCEIHLQVFLYFINGTFIIVQSSPPQNIFKLYIQAIYIQNIYQKT